MKDNPDLFPVDEFDLVGPLLIPVAQRFTPANLRTLEYLNSTISSSLRTVRAVAAV